MSKRDTLFNLLNKAEKATNEAEAMATLEKAMAYADKYGLSIEDVKNNPTEAKYEKSAAYSGERAYHPVDQLLYFTICKFAHVAPTNAYADKDGDWMIEFFGHEIDVDLANWIRDTIRDAMDLEWGVYRDFVYKKKPGDTVAKIRGSFLRAMSDRLRERMRVLTDEHDAKANATGRELIVLKHALLDQKMKEHGLSVITPGRGRSVSVDAQAYAAGYSAGGRVNLGRGVSGSKPLQIGKR